MGLAAGGNGFMDCCVKAVTILWSDIGVFSADVCNIRLLLFVRRRSSMLSFLVGTLTYWERKCSDINLNSDFAAWSEFLVLRSSQLISGWLKSPPMMISMC